jgi:capsular polysaccharide biosynthesis protein
VTSPPAAPATLGITYFSALPQVGSLAALLEAGQACWESAPAGPHVHDWYPTYRQGRKPAAVRPRRTRRPAIRLAVLEEAVVLPGGLVLDASGTRLAAESINGLFESDPATLHHMRGSLGYQGFDLDLERREAVARRALPEIGGRIDEPVMHFTYRSDLNYTHFMLEVLPKLHHWQSLPEPRPRLLVSRHVEQHLAPLLVLYGIGRDRLIVVPEPRRGTALRIRRLYLGAPLLWTREEPVGLLRRGAAAVAPLPDAPRRFYIARPGPKAWFRRLLNEPAVLAELAALGFVPLALERYSLPQQVALFRQAECVAGVYGGGFFNAIHCQPGTRILSLTSPDYHRAILDSLPASEALRGVTVLGESFSAKRDRNNSPFVIDLEALRGACHDLGYRR